MAIFLAAMLLAGAPAAAADRPGSADHPLFPRYDGAMITEYDVKALEQARPAQARNRRVEIVAR